MLKLKADLHHHVLGDPKDKIKHTAKKLINIAANKKYDVLSITCHDKVHYNNKLATYAKSKGILLIPGVEKTIKGKHILIYGITQKNLEKIKSWKDLIELKKKKDILIIAAHPFFLKTGIQNLIYKHKNILDALEIMSLTTKLYNPNKKTISAATKLKKPLVGNTDTHVTFQFGTTYTIINAKKTQKSIFKAIKKGKTKVISNQISLYKFVKTITSIFFYVTKFK